MKNIWIINHYAMPPEYEVRVRNNMMAKYLQESGYKVKIFAASTIHNTNINLIKDKKTLFIEKSYDDLNFVHIRTSDYKGNGISRIINMLEFPLRLYRAAKKVKSSPDIIICNLTTVFAIMPYWLAKRYKCKFILEVRDLWPESFVAYMRLSKTNPIIWALYKFEKWIYKKADKIIFTMEGGKDYIIDKGWDRDIDIFKIYHINNGIDLETFSFNKEHNVLEDADLNDGSTFKVIYTGSIRLVNNVKKIIDAAKIIIDFGHIDIKFLIYGDGSDREYLEQYCVKNNIDNVIFKGHIGKRNIPYVLSKSSLNIIVGKNLYLYRYGLSPNKMFDYFASGKPIISNVECGYDMLKQYNCGITVQGGSAGALAEGILKFYNMTKEEYAAYCNNALRAAQEFDYETLTDKLEKALLEE